MLLRGAIYEISSAIKSVFYQKTPFLFFKGISLNGILNG